MTNTNKNAEFTWETVENDFIRLVKASSYRTYKNQTYVDPSISYDDLFQIGMLKLFDCYTKYNHLPYDEFKKIFKTSLQREIKYNCRSSKNIDEYDNMLLVTAAKPLYEDTKHLDKKVKEIEKRLRYKDSPKVFKEMLNPSEKTLNLVKKEIEEKQKEFDEGKNVRVPQTLKVKQRHIRESLGLTYKQFSKAVKEVRDVAQDVFEVEESFFK